MKSLVLSVLLLTYVVAVCALALSSDQAWVCADDEVYYKCSLEVCFTQCRDLKITPPCRPLPPDCYLPACLCKDGMLKNNLGRCVTAAECD